MPTPSQQPQGSSQQQRRRYVVPAGAVPLVALILGSGAPPAAMVSSLGTVFGAVSPAVLQASLALVLHAEKVLGRPAGPGPAMAATLDAEATYRAAYLANAVQRMQAAVSSGQSVQEAAKAEVKNLQRHVQAQRNRREAAQRVDAVVGGRRPSPSAPTTPGSGPSLPGQPSWVEPTEPTTPAPVVTPRGRALVGWQARMDSRTSPECAAANGLNFYADRPPAIGYPGAVHPHCRCRPRKPWPNAGLVDSVMAGVLGSH